MRYLVAIRTASSAMSKQSDGVDGASTATGDSPFRPYSAISRSACSVLVGMPVDGPARWMSQMISGSSTETARPMVSALSAMPGPEVVVTPSAAAERRAERRADAADLVLGLERADPEPLVLGQLVQDVRGRRDRVGAEEQRQPGPPGRGDQAVGQRAVAGDVPVGARRPAVAGLTSYWTENASVVSP